MRKTNLVRDNKVRLRIAIPLLAIAIAVTAIGFLPRIHLLLDQDRPVHLAIFLAIWGFSIACLIIAAIQPNRIVRWFWALVFSTSVAASQIYYAVSGSELGAFDVVSLWQASHEAGRAFEQYAPAIVWPAILFVFTLAVFVAWPSPRHPLMRRMATALCWVPVLPILVVGGIVVLKEGGGSQGMPQQFAPVAVTAVTLTKVITSDQPQRMDVEQAPTRTPAIRNIVLLVDESIRADYIDWRPGNAFTPNMAALRNRFANFGPSASAGTCSHYSNALIRLGGAAGDIISSVNSNPSIWKYAKAAGYRTVFIDAQAPENKSASRLQNFMTVTETADIDRVVMFEGVAVPELDFKLLEVVREEMSGGVPVFIYANKNGAHFPYDKGYPVEQTRFHPTETENGSTSTPTLINSYRNNVRWSVDRFFGEFLDNADFAETLLIYTSDHGQNFETGRLTHCNVEDPDPREALVPMMTMTGDTALDARLKQAAAENHAATSHFQLTPTLLDLMGFDTQMIATRYGATLFETAGKEPGFTSGDVFGLFSDGVRWNPIDLEADYLEPHARDMDDASANGGMASLRGSISEN